MTGARRWDSPDSSPTLESGELSPPLQSLIEETLKSWDRSESPAAVVGVGSRCRPRLVHALAQRIGEIGRLPLLGALTRTDAPPVKAAGHSTHRWQAAQAALLVDDLVPFALASRS